MDAEEQVILVNEQDEETGLMPKMEAHVKGVLHRAFSVFIFNSHGELLLQRRALSKYHSAGLWSNTCCSHPRPGENTKDAAVRRLKEEMGIVCDVKEVFSFIYKAHLENELTEHEFDHVFTGVTDAKPVLNAEEVDSWVYLPPDVLMDEIALHPQNYSAWFRLCINNYRKELFF